MRTVVYPIIIVYVFDIKNLNNILYYIDKVKLLMAAINSKLSEMRTLFATYYNNFFFDNKEIIAFLRDITVAGGNVFDSTTKQILALNVNQNGQLILRRNNANTELYNKYMLIISSIYATIQTMVHIMRSTTNYNDIITALQKVKLINTAAPADIVPILRTIDPNLNTKYMIQGNTLYIYDNAVKALEIDKPTYKYKEYMHALATDDNIIKNHIYFMLSFSGFNFKSQLLAYYYLIITIKLFLAFYYNSEILLDSGSNATVCSYFNDGYSSQLAELSNAMDALISSSGDSMVLKEINAVCTNVCPVTFKLELSDDVENLLLMQKETDMSDEFFVLIDEQQTDQTTNVTQTLTTTYEILNATYLYVEGYEYLKVADTVILKAYSTQATGCSIDGKYPSMNIALNDRKIIKIRPKSISDMRRDFITSGMQLGTLNSNIQHSKDKINRMAKNYNKQNDINKSINFHQTVYWYIIAALIVSYLVLYFVDFNQSLKITASCAGLVVVIIMLIINYYMKYDYIEPFHVATVDATPCEQLGVESSIARRNTFIQNNMTSFTETMSTIVTAFHIYISTLDSLDLFKKMAGSLKTEMRQFKEHNKYYKYKEKMDTKTIDIMKHDMIQNTAYINTITFVCLIMSVFFICYFYRPEFFKTYVIIAIILICINLAIYYLVILKPVRTRARNKYWAKPSEKTILSVD